MLQRLLAVLVFSLFAMMANPAHAVYIGDSSGYLYELDVATNTSTLLGNSGVGAMYDIALDPISGTLYGVTGATGTSTLYSLDKTNGSATMIGSTGEFINGLTFDSSGTLFGSGGTSLFTVDLGSGAASTVGDTGFSSSGDIAFDSAGNLYLSASIGSGKQLLVSVDPISGAGTSIGEIGFLGVYGLNFMGSTLYGFTIYQETISIDTSTGVGTLVATNGIKAYGADGGGGVTVPEPASIALLGLGLVGLGFARKRAT